MEPTRFCTGEFNVEASFSSDFSFDLQNRLTYEKLLKLPPEDIVEVLSYYVELKSLCDLNTLTRRVDKFS